MPVQHFISSLKSMILFKIGCFYESFPRLFIYLIKLIEKEGINEFFCLMAFLFEKISINFGSFAENLY